MSLQIAQVILEQAAFVHAGNFLAEKPGGPADAHTVNFEVEIPDLEDSDVAIVRLKVKCDNGPQYKFVASYLIVFGLGGVEGGPELNKRIAATGVTMLMPILRELVGNLTMRGRFGPVWLPALNVDALVNKPEAVAVDVKPASRARKRKKTAAKRS